MASKLAEGRKEGRKERGKRRRERKRKREMGGREIWESVYMGVNVDGSFALLSL